MFVIILVIYAFTVFLYSLKWEIAERKGFKEDAKFSYEMCVDNFGKSNSECMAEYTSELGRINGEYGFGFIWRGFGWGLLIVVPAVFVIPPVIAYGTIWGLVKTVLWVRHGFKKKEEYNLP